MQPPTHPTKFDKKKANFESALEKFNEFLNTLDPEWRRAVLIRTYDELCQILFEFHVAAEAAIATKRLCDCTDRLQKRRIHASFHKETRRLCVLYKKHK